MTSARIREAGLTLVEVLVAVTISAALLAPVGVGLVQALTVIPESSARTRTATDRAATLLEFSDDVAQAQNVVGDPDGTPLTNTGTTPWSLTCSPGTARVLRTATADLAKYQTSPATPWELSDYVVTVTATSAPSYEIRLVKQRRERTGLFGTERFVSETQLATGRCTSGQQLLSLAITPVTVGLGGHKQVTMAVTLAETPRTAPETIIFHGSLRIDS
jgi:Tfp pilus assembly protein PilV